MRTKLKVSGQIENYLAPKPGGQEATNPRLVIAAPPRLFETELEPMTCNYSLLRVSALVKSLNFKSRPWSRLPSPPETSVLG